MGTRSAPPISRTLHYLKRCGFYAGMLVVLGALACLILALPDLFFGAPTPPVVARVEAARSNAAGAAPKIGQILKKQTAGAALAETKFEPVALDPNQRFITPEPGMPTALLDQAAFLNDEFSSLTRAVIVLRGEAPTLPFELTIARYFQLMNAAGRMAMRIAMEWPDSQRAASPAFQSLTQRRMKIVQALAEVAQDSYVRHGRWRDLARNCEMEQWERWPEAVYYWRRVGGIEGYWHIIGGAACVRTRSLGFLKPLRRLLPYQPAPLQVLAKN